MIYQSKLTDIFAIDSIVATLKGDAMIPYMRVAVYSFVQLAFTVPVPILSGMAIHLELA